MAKIRTPISEKVRKRISDKVHFKKSVHKPDAKKKFIAMLRKK